jgi:GDP-L-fucose synthase
VLPAFIRRFHEAKLNNADVGRVLGRRIAKREFLHVDDLAEACVS